MMKKSPTHAQYVEWRGEDPKLCKVVLSDWPYECEAKDKHPGHVVYVCETHSCWWHEPDWQPADVPEWHTFDLPQDIIEAARRRLSRKPA